MKRIKICIYAFWILAFTLTVWHPKNAYAETQYTIHCISHDETDLGTLQVNTGGALGTLPAVDDLYIWIDSMGNTVTSSTIPNQDMTITAIKNSEISDKGVFDNGNLTWFITDHKLYVTGSGTIGTIPSYNSVNSTKIYGLSLGDVEIDSPSTVYECLNKPAVGDEQNGGYNVVGKPENSIYTYPLNISRPVRFEGQTINYPHATVKDFAPWLDHAADITDMFFAETVSFSGNFSLYFNLNSTAISPSKLQISVYTNLKNIYIFGDTSNITQMSGMYAFIPTLENIYIKSGTTYAMDSCTDTSGMFYGDEKLTVNTSSYQGINLDSIINNFGDTSSNTDTRYMFFSCKSISHPSIGNLNMSSVTDASYMCAGANSMQLTLSGSNDPWDISAWDMSHVASTTAMFSGSTIDMSAADPLANLWGDTTSQVIVGNLNMDAWDLSSLKISVFMFAQNPGITGVTWTTQAPQLCDASAMYAFDSGLDSIIFDGLNTPMLLYTDVMFFKAAAAGAEMSASSWNISQLTEARLMYYGTGFTKIILNDTNPASLKIAVGMFANNPSLVSFGEDCLSIWRLSNLEDAAFMFFKNPMLQIISSGEWGMESVKKIDYMFAEDPSLTTLNLNWKIGNALTSMDCFLYGNDKLTTLDFSSWDTTSLESAYAAFAKMSVLSSVDLTGIKLTNIKVINGLFADDCSLASIDFNKQSANSLIDASGAFYNNILLKKISGIDCLIGASTENLSYMLAGCISIDALDISSWDTTGVKYFQGFLDNASSLKTLSIGADFSTVSALTTAAMLRNNASLTNASIQDIIIHLSPEKLESAYEMFSGDSLLEAVDLSTKDFSSVKNYTRMFCNDPKLSSITLPESFLKNADNMENVFFVTDDSITTLNITASTSILPSAIANYSWEADNRLFLKINGCYIDEKAESSYTFTTSSAKNVPLHLDVSSALYVNNSALPISYRWTMGENVLSEDSDTFSATKTNTGTISVSAYIKELSHGRSVSADFNISDISSITGISASYTGNPVVVGTSYSLDDVNVKVITADNQEVALSSSDYTVNSNTVSRRGNNTFVVTYTDDSSNIWSTTFSVPGYKLISSIEALYVGPAVAVGSDYSLDYVYLTAYYADDTNKTNGLQVTPSSVDSQTIQTTGSNTFTAYYIDENNSDSLYSATFAVTGYTNKNISSISAEYKGGNIKVGEKYSKDNVIVTVAYDDKTSAVTKDFTESSLLVKEAGKNSYTATVVDEKGHNYTANYTVTGVTSSSEISSMTAVYNGSTVKIGQEYDKNDVVVTLYYGDGTSKTTTDFTVNSTTVTNEGDNTFTATYADTDNTVCTASFTVPGWSLSNISSIDAVYNGPAVLIGSNYSLSDVTVTIKFSDGTADMTTTDFSVSSMTVTSLGDNIFTATVVDSSGTKWADDFIVSGTDDATVITGSYRNSTLGVKTGDVNNIPGIIMILTGLLILLIVLIIIRIMVQRAADSEVHAIVKSQKK